MAVVLRLLRSFLTHSVTAAGVDVDCADGGVSLKQYEVSVEGLVQQYVECYDHYDSQLENLWLQSQHFW